MAQSQTPHPFYAKAVGNINTVQRMYSESCFDQAQVPGDGPKFFCQSKCTSAFRRVRALSQLLCHGDTITLKLIKSKQAIHRSPKNITRHRCFSKRDHA